MKRNKHKQACELKNFEPYYDNDSIINTTRTSHKKTDFGTLPKT